MSLKVAETNFCELFNQFIVLVRSLNVISVMTILTVLLIFIRSISILLMSTENSSKVMY